MHKLFDSRLIDKSINFSSIVPRYVLFNCRIFVRSKTNYFQRMLARINYFSYAHIFPLPIFTSLKYTLQRYPTNIWIRSIKFWKKEKILVSTFSTSIFEKKMDEEDKRFDINWEREGRRSRIREEDRKKKKRWKLREPVGLTIPWAKRC